LSGSVSRVNIARSFPCDFHIGSHGFDDPSYWVWLFSTFVTLYFEVVPVGEELDVSYDGVIILSWFNSRVQSRWTLFELQLNWKQNYWPSSSSLEWCDSSMLASSLQKSYTSVSNSAFNSVGAQTMFTWIELDWLLNQDKIITPSYETSSSSPTSTTSNTILTTITGDCITPNSFDLKFNFFFSFCVWIVWI
jgi:hypothetical protein